MLYAAGTRLCATPYNIRYVQHQPPAALGTATGSSSCCQQRSGLQLLHLAAAAQAGLLSAVNGSSRQQLPHLAAAALAAGS